MRIVLIQWGFGTMQSFAVEHEALCRHLAQAQQRCSAALRQQEQALRTLQGEIWRARVLLLLRTTEALWLRDDLRSVLANLPRWPDSGAWGVSVAWQPGHGRFNPAQQWYARTVADGPKAHSAALRAVAEAASRAAACQPGCVDQAMAEQRHDGVCGRTGEVCVVWEESR